MSSRIRSTLIAVYVALASLGLVWPPVASAAERVNGRVALTDPYGVPAERSAMVVVTNPDGSQESGTTPTSSDGTISLGEQPGSTVTITIRGQAVTALNQWDTAYCDPGYQPPQDVLTVTMSALGPDEPTPDDDPTYVSSRNTWNVQVKPVVYEMTEPGVSAVEQQFVALVNAERTRRGSPPLAVESFRSAAADAHSTAVAVTPGIFGHAGVGCEDPNVRYAELGGVQSSVVQEIFTGHTVCGDRSAASALASFLNSPNHALTLLDPAARYIGVAHVEGQWTAIVESQPEQTSRPLPNLPRRSPNKLGCAVDAPPTTDSDSSNSPVVTKRASFASLKATSRGGKLMVSGRLRLPVKAKATVWVKLSGRRAVAVRTDKAGAFKRSLRVRARKGAKVKISVKAAHGLFGAVSKTVHVS